MLRDGRARLRWQTGRVDERTAHKGRARFLGPPRVVDGHIIGAHIDVPVRRCGKVFPSPLGEEYGVPCRAAWAVRPAVDEGAERAASVALLTAGATLTGP